MSTLGFGLLNVASLILGLTAWILPLAFLTKLRDRGKIKHETIAYASVCCALAAIFCQMIYTNHLVDIEDVSALIDTNDAVLMVSTVLLIGTALLNIIIMILRKDSRNS
jgi:cytochrome c oxidase subunit 4